MRCLRLLSLTIALGLTACFVQHPQLIGSAEKVKAGQWSGTWVTERTPSIDKLSFHVTDVDPAQGIFTYQNADADDNEKMELHLRRVGEQLFLNLRGKPESPWILFVVEEATPDKIVLAWKPAASPFEAAIAKGDFKARLTKSGDGEISQIIFGDVSEITFAEMSEKEAEMLAKNWRELFTAERITLKRFVAD